MGNGVSFGHDRLNNGVGMREGNQLITKHGKMLVFLTSVSSHNGHALLCLCTFFSFFFPEVFFHARVIAACPATTDSIFATS